MGIINRFRARLQSLSSLQVPTKFEMKPNQTDERSTKTMCVLSAVLLFPCVSRLPSPFLISCVGVAYVMVVLPMMLTGGSMHKVLEMVAYYVAAAKDLMRVSLVQLRTVFDTILDIKSSVELAYLRMGNISTLLNQMIFFTMCDRYFCPNEKLTSMYSLMFYNVIAYCAAYVQQLLAKEDWSPYVRISKSTNVKHLAMTTTKIVLEFTKAVTFIITAVFMLLVFGLEQGLEHYHPTWPYLMVTAFYYAITEKTFAHSLPGLLESMDLEGMEGLEKLWAPVLIKTGGCLVSALLSLPLLALGNYRFAAVSLYANVYLCYRDVNTSSWSALEQERSALAKFRQASGQEVRDIDDVCAVCLQPMRFARVTACHHMFHGDCLRLCLKESNSCPMCKRAL